MKLSESSKPFAKLCLKNVILYFSEVFRIYVDKEERGFCGCKQTRIKTDFLSVTLQKKLFL